MFSLKCDVLELINNWWNGNYDTHMYILNCLMHNILNHYNVL